MKRKRSLRNKGRKIFALVPSYSIECTTDKPVTAARKFVQKGAISAPALIVVRKSFKIEKFFWSKQGMFGESFAAENYFNFSELNQYDQEEHRSSGVQKNSEPWTN